MIQINYVWNNTKNTNGPITISEIRPERMFLVNVFVKIKVLDNGNLYNLVQTDLENLF